MFPLIFMPVFFVIFSSVFLFSLYLVCLILCMIPLLYRGMLTLSLAILCKVFNFLGYSSAAGLIAEELDKFRVSWEHEPQCVPPSAGGDH